MNEKDKRDVENLKEILIQEEVKKNAEKVESDRIKNKYSEFSTSQLSHLRGIITDKSLVREIELELARRKLDPYLTIRRTFDPQRAISEVQENEG